MQLVKPGRERSSLRKGLAARRAGVIKTTFKEETESDWFGEQVDLCGGADRLIRNAFEVLVENGYQPEIAYFECLHELKLIVDLIQRYGISGMYRGVSETARYGGLTVGGNVINQETKERMRNALRDIQSGAFAERWVSAYRNEKGRAFEKYLDELDAHPIEQVGRRLREMMWPGDASASGKNASGQNSRPVDIPKPRRNPLQKKQPNPVQVKRRRGKGTLLRSDPIELKAASLSNSKSTKKVEILDATLRERTFGVSFSVGEKISIANLLSTMGVNYVESPAPERNPNEIEYLKQAKSILQRTLGGSYFSARICFLHFVSG